MPDIKIRKFVYRVRARLREQQIIDTLLKTVGFGLVIAVCISLLSLVVSFFYAVVAAAVVSGLSFVMGILIGIRKTPSPMESALAADAKGHKERISTAFFLKGKEDAFSSLQKKDALKVIDHFDIRKEFPLRLPIKQVVLLIGLAVLFTVSSLIDTPARELARVRYDVAEDVKEDIARLEKVEKELEEKKEISEAEAAEIKEQLENAKKELKEIVSYEDLKKAEERITKKLEMASEKTNNKTLRETLSEAANEAKEAAATKQEDMVKEAEEALAKAEKGSRKDKKDAYEKLKKLAGTVGDEALQEAAQEYKDSEYSDSDYAAANSALSDAIHKMAEQSYASNSSYNHSSNSSQNSNGNSGNQNNNGKQSSDNSQNNNWNQNSNNSQNNQKGSGQTGNRNDGQNGQVSSDLNGNQQGGNGNGQSGNDNGYGNGRALGGGWNRGSKNGQEGSEKTNEAITVPEGEIGDDENLTGKANGNDSSTKEKSSQSRTWSGNKVSYGQVSAQYKDKAYKKVNGSNYPGKLKDKIRNYFDGLN